MDGNGVIDLEEFELALDEVQKRLDSKEVEEEYEEEYDEHTRNQKHILRKKSTIPQPSFQRKKLFDQRMKESLRLQKRVKASTQAHLVRHLSARKEP